MASLKQHPESGQYHLRFRFEGQSYRRSLKTGNRREAEAVLARAEETMLLIRRGRIEVPEQADIVEFLLSDGKNVQPPQIQHALTLPKLFDNYQANLPAGVKEPSTLRTEQTHLNHLRRLLPTRKNIASLVQADMQKYVNARLKERCGEKFIQPDTVKKELATFRVVWNWAIDTEILEKPCPLKGIALPKRKQKLPFMTWDEIVSSLSLGKLTPEEETEIWDALYLQTNEVEACLLHIEETSQQSFVYPMMMFAAYTGARRSELVRSRLDDLDFHSGMIRIREKKRSREYSLSYRYVPMAERLSVLLQNWVKRHPGGQNTLVSEDGTAITAKMATYHLRATIDNSRWSRLRGFHVFRHSFASNLASGGVDQRLIDEWMGHQTEEMRKRYRHLFPDQQREALESVFGTAEAGSIIPLAS